MKCKTPFYVKVESTGRMEVDYVLVPCGKCPDCLRTRANQWVFRLEQEYKNCICGFFITLTYDDDHLPVNGVMKEDCQKFIKRFRKYLDLKFKIPVKLRYFLCSEYGDSFGRPHYHFLAFLNHRVSLIDVSNAVNSTWNMGRIDVGRITPASIRYVSKYALKETKPQGLNSVFSLMSRRPAIGANFLTAENYRYCLENGARYGNRALPRYYREKLFDVPTRFRNRVNYMKNVFKNESFDEETIKKEVREQMFIIYQNRVRREQDQKRLK